MGNRIHVQIRREIEYGDCGFNWQIDELKRLLEDSGCDVLETLNDDAVGDWEIPEEIRSYFDADYVGRATDEEFRDEVVSTLRRFEQTGDHRNGFYHFSWF